MANTYFDGDSLTPKKLVELASDFASKIDLAPQCWEKVKKCRDVIDGMVKQGNRVVYGVNTGFGNFAYKVIAKEDLKQLQLNLIRSHSVGVGNPLSQIQVRMLQLLRINTLARGRSGISQHNLNKYIQAFNSCFTPLIPRKGTVGASGDLAPLAHLALGMIGEGMAWCRDTNSYIPAAQVMAKMKLEPILLEEKQGLALINGTQFMASLTSQALMKAKTVIKLFETLVTFSFEVFGLDESVFSEEYIQFQRSPEMKSILRSVSTKLLPQSELHQARQEIFKGRKLSISLRESLSCLATCLENLRKIERIVTEEINGTTDNPLVYRKEGNRCGKSEGFEEDLLLSAGNFHGEYIAKAADMLSITLNSLGKYSERRIECYVNGCISKLPEFLCQTGKEGLNSGFMIAQCTSAALMSENKKLVIPASSDSIPTSANQEDHVSMGGYSARKVLTLTDNLISILSIELLMACQAVDIVKLKPSEWVQKVHSRVREHIPFIESDVFLGQYIQKVERLVNSSHQQKIGNKPLDFDFLADAS